MAEPLLAQVFLGARSWSGATEELESVLRGHVRAAREAWPDVALAADTFVRHLAGRLPSGAGMDELRAVRAADVYLTCACAGGDEQAIAALESRYFGEIDAAAARMRAGPDAAIEVKQLLRRILFVSEGKRPAAAAEFAGRGDIRGWIRVAAVRELVRILSKQKREVRVDDESFFDVLSPAQDPELAYLRDLYRAELGEAVRAAFAVVPARERALLRYQIVDGLSIDQIGAIYGVHRATAARWLQKAREGILARTRVELERRFGIKAEEVDSIIRLVQSRLDVSLERVLGR